MRWGRSRQNTSAARSSRDGACCPVPEPAPESNEAGEVSGRGIQFFTMPGCPACVSVETALERLCAERPELSVERIDLAEQPRAAARYGVMACPAVAVDGKLIAVGNIDLGRLRKLVQAAPPLATQVVSGCANDLIKPTRQGTR